jgi:hypothetical protein
MPGDPPLRLTAPTARRQFSSDTASSINLTYIAFRRKVRRVSSIASSQRVRRGCTACPSALPSWLPLLWRLGFESFIAPVPSPFSSSVWFFSPSLRRHYRSSSLLRPLLTFPRLSPWRSPRVKCRICPLAPTGMRLDNLWASLFSASSPPAPGLAASSCSFGREFACRFFQLSPRGSALRFGYGCRHRPRLAPFIQLGSAHAGHILQRRDTSQHSSYARAGASR